MDWVLRFSMDGDSANKKEITPKEKESPPLFLE